MKTIKILMIATISILVMGNATANTHQDKNPTKAIHLFFDEAMKIEWVVELMSELDSDFLSTTQPRYTISIQHNNTVIRISGSYNQWAWFFRPSGPDIDNPPNLKQIRHR
jgi:hypothetical protein